MSIKTQKLTLSIKALELAEEKEAVQQYGSTDSGASLGDIWEQLLKDQDEKAIKCRLSSNYLIKPNESSQSDFL